MTWYALFVRRTDGTRARFGLGPSDAAKKTLTLKGSWLDGTNGKSWVLTATAPRDGELVLAGTIADAPISAHLRRVPRPEFLLETRGFRWINEFPDAR